MICTRCGEVFDDNKVQCPSCKKWIHNISVSVSETVLLSDVVGDVYIRIRSGVWDPIFSDPEGIVNTSATLIGGMPGAGKSTWALQFAAGVVEHTKGEVLYLPTEETPGQIRPRANRLGIDLTGIRFMNQVSTDTSRWEAIITEFKPKAIILDSIIGLTRDPHTAVVIADFLKKMAQAHSAPAIIIDHITKQDDFAGLMKLQHAVDTLIGMRLKEDESRIMQPFKNRFGPTNKEVRLTMGEKGLTLYEAPKKKTKVTRKKLSHNIDD